MKAYEFREMFEHWTDGSGMDIVIVELGFDEDSKYGKLAIDFDYKIEKPYPSMVNDGLGGHGALTLTAWRTVLPEATLHLVPPGHVYEYVMAMEKAPYAVTTSLKAINGLTIKEERDMLDRGIYLCVSAGNDGSAGESPFATYHFVWTAVAAVHYNGSQDRWYVPGYTSYGKGAVDFAGVSEVELLFLPKPYVYRGTSCAQPYLGAVASAINQAYEKQHGRRATKSEIDDYMRHISVDVGEAYRDLVTGWGLPILPKNIPYLRPNDLIEIVPGQREFMINGVRMQFDNAPFIDPETDRTNVELNGVSLAVGASVWMDEKTGKIYIRR